MNEIAFPSFELSPLRGNSSRIVLKGTKMRMLVEFCSSLPIMDEHADHLETNSVQQYGVAHCGTPGEQVARHFPAENAYAAALVVVLVIEPAPNLQGDGSHLAVNRGNTRDLAVGAGVIADGADIVARDDWRNVYARAWIRSECRGSRHK